MARTLRPVQPGIQPGMPGEISKIGDGFTQREIPLMQRLNGPAVVHPGLVAGCRSYRDAVRLGFAARRVKGMTLRTIAELAGVHVPHMSDYLHMDDVPTRRDLPAKHIAAFEQAVGNTAVSQWIAGRSTLTVVEAMAFEDAA